MTTDELHSCINEYFQRLVGPRPRNFQRETIFNIFNRQDVLLRAPTGSGKTEPVIDGTGLRPDGTVFVCRQAQVRMKA